MCTNAHTILQCMSRHPSEQHEITHTPVIVSKPQINEDGLVDGKHADPRGNNTAN